MENNSVGNSFSGLGNLYLCEQCGRCSSACPVTGSNGFNIRQIIRYTEIAQTAELLKNLVAWSCLVCGRCEDACPNDIHILDLIRVMRRSTPKELIPPVSCIEACPVGINIPSFIGMIKDGEEAKAIELILQRTPMPGILGRVCHRPCESKCRRTQIDSPVSICNLKRYVSDSTSSLLERMYKPGKETKKKVLVVGSGPAGLSASYYLRRKGHSVTLVEEREEPGGMMRYGIPEYRLPKVILDAEIDRIISMGIDLRTNASLDTIARENFDAVFIATGLQLSREISLGYKTLSGVMLGLDFLIGVYSQTLPEMGSKLLVVGGGNVAIDVAMSAVRIGIDDVTLVCLEDQESMPADVSEIKLALDEGIKILNSWGLNRVLGNDLSSGVELINCVTVFDEQGCFKPEFGTKTMKLIVDQVILAIGQIPNEESLKNISFFIGDDIKTTDSLIDIDSKNKIIKCENVFAGGDAVIGAGSVAEAIDSGRSSAASIDCLLGGDGVFCLDDTRYTPDFKKEPNSNASFSYISRQRSSTLPLTERVVCFSEINCGLTQEQAIIETSRCLRCDLEYKAASL